MSATKRLINGYQIWRKNIFIKNQPPKSERIIKKVKEKKVVKNRAIKNTKKYLLFFYYFKWAEKSAKDFGGVKQKKYTKIRKIFNNINGNSSNNNYNNKSKTTSKQANWNERRKW